MRKMDRNGLKKSLKRCSDNLQKRITVLEDNEKTVVQKEIPSGPEVLPVRELSLQSELETIERQIEMVQVVVEELGQRKRWTEHGNVPLNYVCDLCQQSGHIPDYCPAFGKAVERIQKCEKSGLCSFCLQPSTTKHRCYRVPCWYCQTAPSFYRECSDKYAGENHHRALCTLPDLWDNAVDQLRALVKSHNEISSMLEQTEEIQKKKEKRIRWDVHWFRMKIEMFKRSSKAKRRISFSNLFEIETLPTTIKSNVNIDQLQNCNTDITSKSKFQKIVFLSKQCPIQNFTLSHVFHWDIQ